MRVCIYIYIYTMYIYICTYIPLKSKDLALEGLSPKTCFSNKRHQKVSLAYTSKMTIFCPIGLQTGTRCSYMRQHVFFPSVCPGSPRTSILWQKGNMNVHTYFQGFEHDPTSTQQAILYILFKNFWYQCWTHNNFQFGIFDPRVHDFFVSFHDFFVSFHDFLMSFHGLSTVCPRVGPSQKKLCFVFVPQTVHMSRRKKPECRGKNIFQSLKPRVDPNGVLNWWECGQWIVIQQPRNSSNIVVPWLPMFGSSASLGPQIQQFTF